MKKKTKGFGGKGKLTGKLIDELTIFYGLAIRRNVDSVDNMQKEIWAILKHKISTKYLTTIPTRRLPSRLRVMVFLATC